MTHPAYSQGYHEVYEALTGGNGFTKEAAGIQELLSRALQAGRSGAGAVGGAAQRAGGAISGAAQQGYGAATGAAQQGAGAVRDVAQRGYGAASEAVGAGVDRIKDIAARSVSAAKQSPLAERYGLGMTPESAMKMNRVVAPESQGMYQQLLAEQGKKKLIRDTQIGGAGLGGAALLGGGGYGLNRYLGEE